MNKSLLAVVVAMGLAVSMTNAHAESVAAAETELAAIQTGMAPTSMYEKVARFIARLDASQRSNKMMLNQEMQKFNLPRINDLSYDPITHVYTPKFEGEYSYGMFPSSFIFQPSLYSSQGSAATTAVKGYDDQPIKDDIATNKAGIAQNKQNINNAVSTANSAKLQSQENTNILLGTNTDPSTKDTSWLGTKSLVQVVEDNQNKVAETADNANEAFTNALDAQHRSTVNEQNITTMGETINQHATEINKLQDASRASLEVVKEHAAAIDNNTNHIANHERRIQNNEQELANHEQRIQANEQWQGEAEASVNELIDAHNEVVDEVNAQGQQVASNSSAIESNRQRVESVEKKTDANTKAITKNRKIAAGGVSGAMAMANIPQVSALGHYSVGAGVGGFDGANSVAVGFSARINHTTVVKATASSDTVGNIGYGVGVATEW